MAQYDRPAICDNNVREASFMGIANEKAALFSFLVNMGFKDYFARMNVRLRGVVPKRQVSETDPRDTYEIASGKMRQTDNVILKFYMKNGDPNSNLPFLVDVFLTDGTYLNKWLVENGFANKFTRPTE